MDLVVLSEVRWRYFRTRKQFLLSRFPKRWRIFFAQPPASGGADPWQPRREGNVITFTVPFLKPGTKTPLYNRLVEWPAARAAIERVAEGYLSWRLRSLGVAARPVVLASNIYCAGALSRLPKKLLFYDFNDSPFQFATTPAWASDYWRRMLSQVDAVFVVSEYYRRQLGRQTEKPLVLIGNGVEMSHFEPARPVPADLADCPRPRIGFIGLMSHFLDFDALEALRQACGGGTLVLLGPASPETAPQVRALAARAGVKVLGPRPYADLPAYVQALDLGVIPFRAQDPFVQGINSNKVYQYLAAGIPVVSTPLLDLEPGRWLRFATDPAGMRQAAESVLGEPADPAACRDLARPHDWSVLAERMVEEIERRVAAVS